MRTLICLECQASLDADAVESTGVWQCPSCGQALPEVDDPPVTGDSLAETTPGTYGLPIGNSPPPDSRIEVHEASEQRLVMLIPPGGKGAGGMGCFVTFWNLFMMVFTVIWVSVGPKDVAPLAFIGLFWLVGIGLLIAWIKMKYERTLLLVDPSRVVVQHILFGRKRQLETELFSQSKAMLVEAYSQNDVPVYSVAVAGKDRTIKFGTSLSNGEKDWLADRINLLIAPEALNATAIDSPSESSTLEDESEDVSVAEADLPEAIHLVENTPDRLSFGIPAVTSAMARWVTVVASGLFSLAWFSGVASAAAGAFAVPDPIFRIVGLLFFIPFGAAGLMPLVMSLFAWRGQIAVDLDRERLSVRWHVGPFGVTRTMPFDDIAAVRMTIPPNSDQPRNASPAVRGGLECCVVTSKKDRKFLLLTFLDDDPLVRHVTALVRSKWQSFRPAHHFPAGNEVQ